MTFYPINLITVVNGPHFEDRNHKPEPGLSPTFSFEPDLKPESQICRMSQDVRNCGALVVQQSRPKHD